MLIKQIDILTNLCHPYFLLITDAYDELELCIIYNVKCVQLCQEVYFSHIITM